ncbi:MAG: hypothetical protein B6U69_00085 [Thermofilum sp. ex4484_15]|nr:MAG: hypothetical protein B6U69_00085 [Thermofilum sp. ex4484_15]
MKCEICGKEVTETYTCKLCGRRVCKEDFDKGSGICEICKETLCALCKVRLAIAICNECGRLVCEDCSIKVGVGYLCKDCAKEVDKRRKRVKTVSNSRL